MMVDASRRATKPITALASRESEAREIVPLSKVAARRHNQCRGTATGSNRVIVIATLEASMKPPEARAAAVVKALTINYGISAARLRGVGRHQEA